MDDEVPVLETLRLILIRLGYQVTAVKEGSEAVAACQQALADGQRIPAVILDITIRGGLGGRETMERLLALDPKVKGIVSSGYSNDPVMANCLEYGFRATVGKPYSVDQLGTVLRRVLDTP